MAALNGFDVLNHWNIWNEWNPSKRVERRNTTQILSSLTLA